MTWFWVALALVLVVVVGLWLSWTANRLDRMHHRIDVARASLDTQLLRRSGAALELATSGTLDPARSLLLVDVAHQARAAGPGDVESAESDLSQALRAVLADADEVRTLAADRATGPLLAELAGDESVIPLKRGKCLSHSSCEQQGVSINKARLWQNRCQCNGSLGCHQSGIQLAGRALRECYLNHRRGILRRHAHYFTLQRQSFQDATLRTKAAASSHRADVLLGIKISTCLAAAAASVNASSVTPGCPP